MAPRVLLVSPVADHRNQYATFLRFARFDVAEAVECDGVGQVVSERPDVVVVDLAQTCAEECLNLTRRLREDERTKELPVIVLATHRGPDVEERAERAGVDRVLPAPCPPEALACEVRRVMAARRRQSFHRVLRRRS